MHVFLQKSTCFVRKIVIFVSNSNIWPRTSDIKGQRSLRRFAWKERLCTKIHTVFKRNSVCSTELLAKS